MNTYNKVARRRYPVTVMVCLLFVVSCAATVQAHPFLWKVTSEGDVTSEQEFYLFGTIHLPDPRVTTLANEVERALLGSDAFYAELDLDEANTMLIKQSMWLPEKNSLYDYLPAELETDISQYLQSVNKDLSLEFFAKQKIWVLAITLTILEQQLKYPGHLPLDSVLYERASAHGLRTGGLETVDEQLSVFDNMSVDEQLVFLSDTVEFMKSSKAQQHEFVEESLTAYLAGDLDVLMTHLMSYMKDNAFYEQLLDRLIVQRNVKMVDKIVSLVQQAPTDTSFFAIGAGHFWGEQGINRLLEMRGFTVQRVAQD